MRNILLIVWSVSLLQLSCLGATLPHYLNTSPLSRTNLADRTLVPQIDAFAFENRSLFAVSTLDPQFSSSFLRYSWGFNDQIFPYELYNTRQFTNTASGTMWADPGFFFDNSHQGGRKPMANWVNRGLVAGETYVWVEATNIVNAGRGVGAGARGIIHLEGDNVNLSRSGVYTGPAFGVAGGGFSSTNSDNSGLALVVYPPDQPQFFDGAILDNYWGHSTNFVNRDLMATLLEPPFTRSPRMQVEDREGDFWGLSLPGPHYEIDPITQVGGFTILTNNFGSYTAFTYTNLVGANEAIHTNIIQMVFVPTNSVAIDVRFTPNIRFGREVGAGWGNVASVRMALPDNDPTGIGNFTNYVYLEDYLPFQDTNFFLADNISSASYFTNATKRPNTFYLGMQESGWVSFDFASPANATFDTALISNPDYLSNSLACHVAGYSGTIVVGDNLLTQRRGIQVGSPQWSGIPINDITNLAGRIEIIANKLNLDNVRIHGQSSVIIKANDLVGNKLPLVDAPLMSFDLKSTQPQLLVSNLVPSTANRLQGEIAAASAIWLNASTNGGSTNIYFFQALVLSHNLSLTQQVVIQDLKLRATNVVLQDTFRIGRSFLVESRDLTVTPTGDLLSALNGDIGSSNLVGILNFTNQGSFQASRELRMGNDRPKPYSNIVNYGTLVAGGMSLRSDRLINSNQIQGNFGSVNLEGRDVKFLGTNSILAYGDIILSGKDLYLTNSTLIAGTNVAGNSLSNAAGSLVIAFTNSVNDGGLTNNVWIVNQGFSIAKKAKTGDLLTTTIYSQVAPFGESIHSSAATDYGVDPKGFVNNMAIGRLVLDGGNFSLFRFSPPAGVTNAALYIDELVLLNYATNIDSAIIVDPGIKVYFANSTPVVPKKGVNHGSEDRLRWVSSYAGLFSSTNINYGLLSFDLNTALVLDSDLDSDNDGIPNPSDPQPIWTSVNTDLQPPVPTNSVAGRGFLLTGRALVSYDNTLYINYATNTLEYTLDLAHGPWIVLTNMVTPVASSIPPQSLPFAYFDRGPTNVSRHYRVRVRVTDP